MLMFAVNLDMLGESQNGKNFVETSVRPHIFWNMKKYKIQKFVSLAL